MLQGQLPYSFRMTLDSYSSRGFNHYLKQVGKGTYTDECTLIVAEFIVESNGF